MRGSRQQNTMRSSADDFTGVQFSSTGSPFTLGSRRIGTSPQAARTKPGSAPIFAKPFAEVSTAHLASHLAKHREHLDARTAQPGSDLGKPDRKRLPDDGRCAYDGFPFRALAMDATTFGGATPP